MPSPRKRRKPPVLTIETNHRRFFDMLADGWLHPKPPTWKNHPLLIGVNNKIADVDELPKADEIGVSLTFDIDQLPYDVRVAVPESNGVWSERPLAEIENPEGAALWLGPIPSFALQSVGVREPHHLTNIVSMNRTDRKFDIASFGWTVDPDQECQHVILPLLGEMKPQVVLPDHQNAVAGALALSAWAVPDQSEVRETAPWLRNGVGAKDPIGLDNFGECIWVAARDVLRRDGYQDDPQESAWHIATAACAIDDGKFKSEAQRWLSDTHRILRRAATIQEVSASFIAPAVAAQVALLKNDFRSIEKWTRQTNADPKANRGLVLTTALLSGLALGYSKLPDRIRGNAAERQAVQITAARMLECWHQWPPLKADIDVSPRTRLSIEHVSTR